MIFKIIGAMMMFFGGMYLGTKMNLLEAIFVGSLFIFGEMLLWHG